jgi:hypothetical protein
VTDTNSNEQDAHWRTYIESDVIRFVDLPPGDHDVQIKEVKRGKVTGAGGKSSGKPMIYLVGKDKPWAASSAACQTIESLHGKAPRKWAGKFITIYGDPSVKYSGVAVGGIRVRPTAPKGKP